MLQSMAGTLRCATATVRLMTRQRLRQQAMLALASLMLARASLCGVARG